MLEPMGELLDLTPLPDFTLRIVPDIPGCIRIEAVNAHGAVEQELFCTPAQARALIPALEALKH